jgi:hypothetical protein
MIEPFSKQSIKRALIAVGLMPEMEAGPQFGSIEPRTIDPDALMAEIRGASSLSAPIDAKLASIKWRYSSLASDLKNIFETHPVVAGELNTEEKWHVSQWMSGQITGHHCYLQLQRIGGIFLKIAKTKRDGALVMETLNAMVGRETNSSPWMLLHVFSKSPEEVLQDAVQVVLKETHEKDLRNVSPNQINLLFRKLSMLNLGPGMTPPADEKAASSDSPPSPGEQYFRIQIMLELLRLFVEPVKRNSDFPKSAVAASGKEEEDMPDDRMIFAELSRNREALMEEAKTLTDKELSQQNNRIKLHTDRLGSMKKALEKQLRVLQGERAYAVLGIGADATPSEIKKRYHREALKLHPDKGGNVEDFRALQEAYDTITKKGRQAARAEEATSSPLKKKKKPKKEGEGEDEAECKEERAGSTAQMVETQVKNLAKAAQVAAEQVILLAEMCSHWQRVVQKCRTLAFPKGVTQLSVLVTEGMFTQAVEVASPAQMVGSICVDLFTTALKLADFGSQFAVLAGTHKLHLLVQRGLTNAKDTLASASEAASMGSEVLKALDRLKALGETAATDRQVHRLLVANVCTVFEKVLAVSEKCATLSMETAMEAQRVCNAVVTIMSDVMEGNTGGGSDDDSGAESGDEGSGAQRAKAQKAAKEKAKEGGEKAEKEKEDAANALKEAEAEAEDADSSSSSSDDDGDEKDGPMADLKKRIREQKKASKALKKKLQAVDKLKEQTQVWMHS